MIKVKHKGDFELTTAFLDYILKSDYMAVLRHYGQMGVQALESATPINTGATAQLWYYQIEKKNGKISLIFCNDNVTNEGTPIAILIQYGHATRNGGFVQGIDYINPALRPMFEEMANDIWGRIIDV